MLVNFLGVNLTKFAPPDIELQLGVILFIYLFRCDCNGHEISKKVLKKKVMNHSHLITVENKIFPPFFW
jgi:hypothetical protein